MATLLLNPHYCPDDKDIFDFLNSKNIPIVELKKLLRYRGVFVADSTTKRRMTELVARETFCWEDVTDLIDLVKERTTRRKYIPGDHQTGASFEVVESATHAAVDFLQKKYGDGFEVKKTDDDNIRITQSYKEVSLEKTRLIQVVEKESEIILTKTDDGFTTSRSAGSKSFALEQAIIGEVERLGKDEGFTVTDNSLKLSHLKTNEDRLKFFALLSDKVEGFSFEEVLSAKVESVENQVNEDFDEDSDDELGEESEELVAAIQSLTFQGRDIARSPIYAEHVGSDFFPISCEWRSSCDEGNYSAVKFKAGFTPLQKDYSLEFSISKVIPASEAEGEGWTNPTRLQEKELTRLLSRAAVTAFEMLDDNSADS
ncbi:hypothetical protein JIN77_07310 [Verrucomicrobiaceae bacterium R5-34]|nr:hypothetical protein [Verrucomicrobiaceae bacterium R5-34]